MQMKTLVFNGWAAGPETWNLCTFHHDWVFNYVEQLDGLPDRVLDDCDDAVLVGFSMGGTMALRCLLKYPEKVRALVLISATARMSEDKSTDWIGMSPRRQQALKLGTRMVYRDDPSPMYDERNMDRGLDFLSRTDLRSDLIAFSAAHRSAPRVAIFQSERDFIVRPHNATFLKRVFPAAEITMVPGSEHVLPVAIPELIDLAVSKNQ